MKILVIGGMHGNEPLGIVIVKRLSISKLNNVDWLLANPEAIKINKRFAESDLNRSFGNLYPNTYETIRAKKILSLIKNYDLVLDFHNTQTPNNDSLFIGENFSNISALNSIPIKNCIIATYDCINKFSNKTVSIEISLDSKLNNPEYWVEFIDRISNAKSKLGSTPKCFYKFSRRVTWDEFSKFKLGWKPFNRISLKDVQNLGLKEGKYYAPIFVGSKLTEFYATILELVYR